MAATYALLGVDGSKVATVESYLQEYYTRILRKLKEARTPSLSSPPFLPYGGELPAGVLHSHPRKLREAGDPLSFPSPSSLCGRLRPHLDSPGC